MNKMNKKTTKRKGYS